MRTDKQWEKIGMRHHHGIALPLSALRTKKSCGIGEFNDLLPIIDWCASLNLDVIQLLPLNDTGEDPSPYNAVSSCALNPIYLSLADLPNSQELDVADFAPLTTLAHIDYREVSAKKYHWLYNYYLKHFKPEPSFVQFVQENPWLDAYATYKDETHPQFHQFLQYLCFSQLKKVKEHATAKNVFLKGDIPILLSPKSADVVAEPQLFNLELDAGAPPDFYNNLGQHWGFPLMNWDAMRREQFQWWKRRLSVAENFFHLYRIDHVVGLFRIWGIPKGEKPFNGHFVPPDATLWEPQGREILEMMIDATTMLPIAEDLGVVPDEVRAVLNELGICGTKVIRWKRRWNSDKNYIPYDEYERLSLSTITTHDSEPILLWWKNYPEEAALYAQFKNWPYKVDLTLEQRIEILRDSHHTPSYFHINPLQEYLTILPEFSWGQPEEERINVPGTLYPTNWTYRFRPYVEEIVASTQLATLFAKIL